MGRIVPASSMPGLDPERAYGAHPIYRRVGERQKELPGVDEAVSKLGTLAKSPLGGLVAKGAQWLWEQVKDAPDTSPGAGAREVAEKRVAARQPYEEADDVAEKLHGLEGPMRVGTQPTYGARDVAEARARRRSEPLASAPRREAEGVPQRLFGERPLDLGARLREPPEPLAAGEIGLSEPFRRAAAELAPPGEFKSPWLDIESIRPREDAEREPRRDMETEEVARPSDLAESEPRGTPAPGFEAPGQPTQTEERARWFDEALKRLAKDAEGASVDWLEEQLRGLRANEGVFSTFEPAEKREVERVFEDALTEKLSKEQATATPPGGPSAPPAPQERPPIPSLRQRSEALLPAEARAVEERLRPKGMSFDERLRAIRQTRAEQRAGAGRVAEGAGAAPPGTWSPPYPTKGWIGFEQLLGGAALADTVEKQQQVIRDFARVRAPTGANLAEAIIGGQQPGQMRALIAAFPKRAAQADEMAARAEALRMRAETERGRADVAEALASEKAALTRAQAEKTGMQAETGLGDAYARRAQAWAAAGKAADDALLRWARLKKRGVGRAGGARLKDLLTLHGQLVGGEKATHSREEDLAKKLAEAKGRADLGLSEEPEVQEPPPLSFEDSLYEGRRKMYELQYKAAQEEKLARAKRVEERKRLQERGAAEVRKLGADLRRVRQLRETYGQMADETLDAYSARAKIDVLKTRRRQPAGSGSYKLGGD